MDVSENNGTPKSSILIGFSIIFTIHFGVPLFLETPILHHCIFQPTPNTEGVAVSALRCAEGEIDFPHILGHLLGCFGILKQKWLEVGKLEIHPAKLDWLFRSSNS